ncbi:MAG: CHAT domain-containing protein [Granulosicoccus sp.]
MTNTVTISGFRIRPSAELLQRHPQLGLLATQLSNAYADNEKIVTDESLQTVGDALWEALNLGDSLTQAKQKAGLQSLPVIIESDEPAVLELPWEALHHPEHGFIAREPGFTLSRYIPSLHTELPALPEGPLRILLFSSLPDNLDENSRLQVEDEQAAVQEALAPFEQDGLIRLEMPDDGRFNEFKRLISDFRPHLVYLSGHGQFSFRPESNKWLGSFLFEDAWGRSVAVEEDVLAQCLHYAELQVVVLSACKSGKSRANNLSHGLSYCLHQRGIPHVIGMRESLFDQAGIQFAHHFFAAIVRQDRLDVALQKARAAITRPLNVGVRREIENPLASELSFGQWCLPMLLSQSPERALVDWHFTPTPRLPANALNQTLGQISLPTRFFGRRYELRQLANQLRQRDLQALLITGAGGMGKTAMIGKLAHILKSDGHDVYVYSARQADNWPNFLLDVEMALSPELIQKYNALKKNADSASQQAKLLLRLLSIQHGKKLVLVFDNLETLQEPDSLALVEHPVRHWLQEAISLASAGVWVLCTSRWKLLDWPEQAGCDHYALGKPIYNDFTTFARRHHLPVEFLRDTIRLRRVYEALGGSFRGLEFFAHAVSRMTLAEEDQFLQAIRQSTDEAQTDMAVAEVFSQRSKDEKNLLHRLLAFESAVPVDGVKNLALPDLKNSEQGLNTLLAVSLVERYDTPSLATQTYMIAPLLRDWLLKNDAPLPNRPLLQKAAEYQLYLLEHERRQLDQAIHCHQALERSDDYEEAHRVVLNWIVGPLNNAGLYRSLLDEWLPSTCQSDVLKTQGDALGQTGKQYIHLGDYDTALDYLKQSLEIQQQIGDKSGEGTTLNNISQIYKARGDYDTALDYLKQSLEIRQQIGDVNGLCATMFNIGHIEYQNDKKEEALQTWGQVYQLANSRGIAQALTALESLADQLNLPDGIRSWENLSNRDSAE